MNAEETLFASFESLGKSRSDREEYDPELEALVWDIIGKIADKWTMLAIEVLEEHGRLRFTKLGELMSGISQKMLTKTLRQIGSRRFARTNGLPGHSS